MLRFALLLIALTLVNPAGALAVPNADGMTKMSVACAEPANGSCCPDTRCAVMSANCCAVLPTVPAVANVFLSPKRVAPYGTITQMIGIGPSPAIPPPR